MAAIKHTPGPWEYLDIGEIVAGPDHELCLAIINDGGGSVGDRETSANAYLIAAAPDLLVATADLLDIIDFMRTGDGSRPLLSDAKMASARAAIAKATEAE